MAQRDAVVLPWGNTEYVIKGNKVFRAARAIEPIITITEIVVAAQRGGAAYAGVAEGYYVALKRAGATGFDVEDVHDWVYQQPAGAAQNIGVAMEKLTEILVPPSARRVLGIGAAGQDGPEADPTKAGQPSSSPPSS